MVALRTRSLHPFPCGASVVMTSSATVTCRVRGRRAGLTGPREESHAEYLHNGFVGGALPIPDDPHLSVATWHCTHGKNALGGVPLRANTVGIRLYVIKQLLERVGCVWVGLMEAVQHCVGVCSEVKSDHV